MNVTINNKEYSWGDILVFLWGRPILGLKSIDYKTTKKKELNYGAGRHAYGIQHGRRDVSGSLKISQGELQAMNNAAKAKGYHDLLDVELDILVSYIPEDSAAITVDKIVGVSFTELPKGMASGDMSSEHALGFIALGIEYGI